MAQKVIKLAQFVSENNPVLIFEFLNPISKLFKGVPDTVLMLDFFINFLLH